MNSHQRHEDTSTLTENHSVRGASIAAIQHHYDINDEFYALWLDPTMTYSCALWDEDEIKSPIEDAQLRKLDFHIEQAGAAHAQSVLDIGCGWGSLLKRLVTVHNVNRAVGLTLSESQAGKIREFSNSSTDVKLESWYDHCPDSPYDAIISIGAFEHFSRLDITQKEKIEIYRFFFHQCCNWLKPDGRFSLQTIIHAGSIKKNEFISTEIFPESDLPLYSDITDAIGGQFNIINTRYDGKDYERTCKKWLSRLKAKREEATELVGKQVVERYLKYLALCCVAFYRGDLELLRMTLQRK